MLQQTQHTQRFVRQVPKQSPHALSTISRKSSQTFQKFSINSAITIMYHVATMHLTVFVQWDKDNARKQCNTTLMEPPQQCQQTRRSEANNFHSTSQHHVLRPLCDPASLLTS